MHAVHDALDAPRDKEAVFAPQGHDVGHGCQGHQVQVVLFFEEGGAELKRDGRPAGVRRGAVGRIAVRIDDGACVR